MNKTNVIFEDNHLLIVEKPVNVPTQADSSNDLDFLTILKNYLKEKYNKPGKVYLGLVHRLDRPVGGIMVFAKTSKAAERLSEQIRKNEMQKTYLAVVHGKMEYSKDELVHCLLKDHSKNIVKVVEKNVKGAKIAILDYEVIDYRENLSLVKIHLHTGRSHQIRVQFSTIGHPLYGDQKYGASLNKMGEQIALFSGEVQFVHPISKEIMMFKLNPSDSFPWNLFDIQVR